MAGADGRWDVTMKSAAGAQRATLVLRTHGNGLDGSISGAWGSVDFSGGAVAGDDLAWTAEVEQPISMILDFTVTIDADTMSGVVRLGNFGEASVSGTRVTDPSERERAPIEDTWDELCELGLQTYVAKLDTFGYTVVPPAVAAPDGLADRLLDAVLDVAERRSGFRPNIVTGALHEKAGRGASLLPLGDTMPFLLHEGRVFEEALMNPVMVALATYLCGRSVVLSAMFSSMKGPNPTVLPLHADSRLPAPLPPYAVVCNATIALTEYSREGGCLAIVPGSHRVGHPPQGSDALLGSGRNPRAIPVECEAGSLIVWHGNTWHGAYPRTAPGLRVSVVQYFSRPQLRTMEDLRDQISQEMLDRNPPRFALLTQQAISDGWTGPEDRGKRITRAGKVMAESGLTPEFHPSTDG